MQSADERKVALDKLAAEPTKRGVHRFSPTQEAEILEHVANGHSYTNIAKVFAADPNDKKEVKNISLVVGNIVKRQNKARTKAALDEIADIGDEIENDEPQKRVIVSGKRK